MGLVDSHAHLTSPELRDRLDKILAACDEAGVERVISVGVNLTDAAEAISLSRQHPERIHAAVGFHPHEADKVSDDDLTEMAVLWKQPEVVALGEMGLDYHYDLADRHAQRRVFAGQLKLAAHHDRPLVIHCRSAFDDTVPMLVDHGFKDRRVVFHCFTGTAEEARRVAESGWRISFTGIVTFPNSSELQDIARTYPGDALMIETDSPYLSPVPVRGRRPNEPAHVAHVARFLADLRGLPLEEIAEQTSANARSFFGL